MNYADPADSAQLVLRSPGTWWSAEACGSPRSKRVITTAAQQAFAGFIYPHRGTGNIEISTRQSQTGAADG